MTQVRDHFTQFRDHFNTLNLENTSNTSKTGHSLNPNRRAPPLARVWTEQLTRSTEGHLQGRRNAHTGKGVPATLGWTLSSLLIILAIALVDPSLIPLADFDLPLPSEHGLMALRNPTHCCKSKECHSTAFVSSGSRKRRDEAHGRCRWLHRWRRSWGSKQTSWHEFTTCLLPLRLDQWTGCRHRWKNLMTTIKVSLPSMY